MYLILSLTLPIPSLFRFSSIVPFTYSISSFLLFKILPLLFSIPSFFPDYMCYGNSVSSPCVVVNQVYMHCSIVGRRKPQSKQSGNGHFLAYIPSRGKNQPRLVRAGGACPPPFTISTITYKVKRSVQYAPAESADTHHPISPLPLSVLCGGNPLVGDRVGMWRGVGAGDGKYKQCLSTVH